MPAISDLTTYALDKDAERDWQACAAASPATYYDMDQCDTVEARMVCRPATAREAHAFSLHQSSRRLLCVFTATYVTLSGGYATERYLVRLPLGASVPANTGEGLWRAAVLDEGAYTALTPETIAALRSRSAQGGAQ